MINISEALKKAYATAPTEIVILDTIELVHSRIITPLRFTNDNASFNAVLEADAPNNGSESVTFTALPFEIRLPELGTKSVPEAILTIDNVNRGIAEAIDKIIEVAEPLKIIYRPYLSTDKTKPHYSPPITMILFDININIYTLTAKARFFDFANKKYPSVIYDLNVFLTLRK